MNYLLDTHLLLWMAEGSPKLPAKAREIISDGASVVVFSVASLWEIAIKAALQRSDLEVDPWELRSNLIANRYIELPVSGSHALAVYRVPAKHGDPFDRMLLAQAIDEGMRLLTTDRVLASYGEPVLKV